MNGHPERGRDDGPRRPLRLRRSDQLCATRRHGIHAALEGGQVIECAHRPRVTLVALRQPECNTSYMPSAPRSLDLTEWRRERLNQAQARGEVIALTGLHSLATPWCNSPSCDRCHPKDA